MRWHLEFNLQAGFAFESGGGFQGMLHGVFRLTRDYGKESPCLSALFLKPFPTAMWLA